MFQARGEFLRLGLPREPGTCLGIAAAVAGFGGRIRFAKFQCGLAAMSGFVGIGAGGDFRLFDEVAPAFVVVRGTALVFELLQRQFGFLFAANNRHDPGRPIGPDVVQDDRVAAVCVVLCQKKSCRDVSMRIRSAARKEAMPADIASSHKFDLERLHVCRLQTFGAFGDVELNRLALLQALETARLDRREMHENVFASLTADEAVALGIVKPLYCSLFHLICTLVSFVKLRWRDSEEICAGDWLLRQELLTTDRSNVRPDSTQNVGDWQTGSRRAGGFRPAMR